MSGNIVPVQTNIAKGLFGKLINQGYNAITIHQYTDAQGNTIYAKARLKNAQGKKHIRPFFLGVDNQWKMGEPVFTPNQKPLYYLHKLSQAQSVWIFEGEQKADLMDYLGYAATTTGGSNSITAHDLQPLAGKQCILWRDNDNAGISCVPVQYSQTPHKRLYYPKLGVISHDKTA